MSYKDKYKKEEDEIKMSITLCKQIANNKMEKFSQKSTTEKNRHIQKNYIEEGRQRREVEAQICRKRSTNGDALSWHLI